MNELFLAGMLLSPVTEVDKYNFGLVNREQVYEYWQHSEWYCRYLDCAKPYYQMMHKENEWQILRDNAQWCRDVWYYMDDAFFYAKQNPHADRYRRLELQAMVNVRNLIGNDNYTAGILPPPWPIWMFRNGD